MKDLELLDKIAIAVSRVIVREPLTFSAGNSYCFKANGVFASVITHIQAIISIHYETHYHRIEAQWHTFYLHTFQTHQYGRHARMRGTGGILMCSVAAVSLLA